MRTVARRVANLLKEPCTIYLFEPASRHLVSVVSSDQQGRLLVDDAQPRSISADHGVYGRVFRDPRPCVLHARAGLEVLGVDTHVEPRLAEENIASVLMVPMTEPRGGVPTTIGMVALSRRRVAPGEARDVALLARIVDEAACTVAHAAFEQVPVQLLPLMSALVRAGTSLQVGTALVDAAQEILGAKSAALVSNTRSSTVLATRGFDEERLHALAHLALSAAPVTVVDAADGVHVVVAMRANDVEVGRLLLAYDDEHAMDEPRRALIQAVARQGANALGRTHPTDAERDAWLRLARLSTASDSLSVTIDWDETLQKIGAILVPDFASACALDLTNEHRRERIFEHPEAPSESARSIPLEVSGVPMGFLLLDVVPGESDDVLLLDALARRVAMALESARLFRELQAAVSVRDEFVSIASHELKTPLTALKMCMFGFERFGGANERTATLAVRQVKRLETLVDQLLDVSRIRAGKLELDLATVDLSALAREAAEMMPGRNVEVNAPDPVVGRWDRSRIHQVLVNLITNAVKYGRDQRIDVDVRMNVDRAVLAVRDQGIGIEQSALERIFDRFERAVSSKHFGGFGLGLWISREIVQAHGGSIRARSEVGTGSEFVVELPRAVS
jgi:signal transduction histidine kinase